MNLHCLLCLLHTRYVTIDKKHKKEDDEAKRKYKPTAKSKTEETERHKVGQAGKEREGKKGTKKGTKRGGGGKIIRKSDTVVHADTQSCPGGTMLL